MNTKARLLRKPLTTLFWSLLVAAMALFLGVGSALMYASGALAGIMDEQYTSIAVRTDTTSAGEETPHGISYQSKDKLFTQADLDYFMALDSVEGVYFHTLSAATSPGFRPLLSNLTFDWAYQNVVVAGEVTEILGTEVQESPNYIYPVSVWGVMELEQIFSQNTNFTRRTDNGQGEIIVFKANVTSLEDATYIQEGQRYFFTGQYDIGFGGQYGGAILPDGTVIPNLGPLVTNGETTAAVLTDRGLVQSLGYFDYIPAENPADDVPVMVRINGTLEDFMADPQNEQWARYLDCFSKHNHAVPVLGTEALETFHTFVSNNSSMVQGRFFTDEEYETGAKVCILSEPFAVSSGIALGDTITLSQYLCHQPDTLGYVNNSVVVDERDGMLNNPGIGRITYREFGPEEVFTVVGLYRSRTPWSESSYSVGGNTIFIPQKAQIAGAFGGMSNPDIVILEDEPYSADRVMRRNQYVGGTYGIYFTMKLKNGMVQDFQTTMEASPYRGEFLTLDQGFDAIQSTLNSVAGSTRTLFLAVVLGWLLLAGLYLLLYQGTQRRNVGIMRCLGVRAKQTRNYLWGSGMMVCTIGLVLGTVATCLLTDVVQDKLLASTFGLEANRYSVAGLSDDAITNMVDSSQLPIWVIVAIGGLQLLLLAGALYLQARCMSRKPPRELAGK